MFTLKKKIKIKVSRQQYGTSYQGGYIDFLDLTNLHTWNLHRKAEYISQTSENSFGILPENWTRFHSCNFFKFIRIYTCTFYNVIDYVTLSLFYATDIFVCLMTCLLLVLDYKPFKRCKIIVARLLEQCENAYLSNYICYVGIVYDYIKYGSVLSTAIFLSATIRL